MRLLCVAVLWATPWAHAQEPPRPSQAAAVAAVPESARSTPAPAGVSKPQPPRPAPSPDGLPKAEEPQPKPIHKRPWLWITLAGAAAVLSAGITLGALYGGGDRDPEPRFRGIGN